MRSFEEIPDIAERIKRSKMELQESGFYWAPEWDSQSCCDQDYVNNFKKGWDCRQTEVDELTLQVAEMKSRLNDAYTDGQSAMYTARQTEVDELNQELHLVLNNWNDLTNAIHARTNGTAVAEARQLYEKVDELQKQLIEQGQRLNVQTQQIASLKWQLKRLGYTDNGGELMKPPIGDAPKFDLLDELQKRVDALEKAEFKLAQVKAILQNNPKLLESILVKKIKQALKGGGDE